ncbi:MAG: hypothetical protein DSY66_05010 [Persephonella sp.]|nr:MAG: hypothetical protein DSY53_03055 [Persephonella sp.]RUM60092.1 MAG: hypothetical protein DSY66_05010 [Persephonella sp.]
MFVILILSIVLIFNLSYSHENGKHPYHNNYQNYYDDTFYTQNSYKCDLKKYCSQMESCEEAKFYLYKCGLKKLDRDKDGVPCEKLCK